MTYLGANVPEIPLRKVVKSLKPEHILTFIVRRDHPGNINKYVDRLSRDLKVNHIYIAGKPELTGELKSGKKLQILTSLEELSQFLPDHNV